jgi:hypothetical protein
MSTPIILQWPTQSDRVTSDFGHRDVNVGSNNHEGIDIGGMSPGVSGDPVSAAASGTVTFSGWRGGYGKCVVVDHGEFTTIYGHLQSSSCSVGDEVSPETVIGEMGNTGTSTAAHLHFEVRDKSGRPIDPEIALSKGVHPDNTILSRSSTMLADNNHDPELTRAAYSNAVSAEQVGTIHYGMGMFMGRNQHNAGIVQEVKQEQARVREVQELLRDAGFPAGEFGENKDGVDGKFGKVTEQSVRSFQQAKGMEVTGKADVNTLEVLRSTTHGDKDVSPDVAAKDAGVLLSATRDTVNHELGSAMMSFAALKGALDTLDPAALSKISGAVNTMQSQLGEFSSHGGLHNKTARGTGGQDL